MERQKIFSTNIFIEDNFLQPQRLPAMQEEIERLYKQRTYSDNWQTSPDLDKEDSSGAFKWFAKDVSKAAFDVFDTLDYNVDEIEITGMWGNVLRPGEAHQTHTHSNNFLSGVFYLSSDGATGLTISDPRPAADVLVPRKKKKTQDNSNLLSYKSKQNRIIIFPSWLVHWVPINRSTKDRISISFNIQVKGQLGERHEFQSANI
tara:strand:+ start:69 stop:680 length:612 start_codon:yes stop_codon:yes gene_type:complete